MNITVASKEPEQVMEAQVSAAEAGPSAESSVTTENVEETVQAQTFAAGPDSSSESFSTKADDESYQEMDTPRTSVSTLEADLPAMLAQINLNFNPSNHRDVNSSTMAGLTPAEFEELFRRFADAPDLKLRDFIGDRIMSEEFHHIPFKWTLLDLLNYIIEHDIILPTDEEMSGNREENARLCEEAAKIPLPPKKVDTEREEQEAREMEWMREHPGEIYPRDDLWEIGQPREKVFYRDAATGKWKKRFPVYDPANPKHLRKGEVEVKKGKGEDSVSGAGHGAEEASVMTGSSEVIDA
ncbi:MAG: hypothetical protein Q9212_000594 [Teloschistes hypoglaucus]